MNEVTYKKYLNGERLYKEGKSLSQIGKELHLDRNRLAKFLKERGVHVERMPHKKHINENVFKTIDSEEKAYWLGFLYADGSVTNRSDIDISLQLSDERHVEKFYNFIEFGGKIIKDNYRCRVSFKNVKMRDDLINLGCVPKKSLILKFPSEEQVPNEFIRHFLRGYFDGDGSLICTNKTKAISLIGTYDFLEKTCELIGIPKGRIYPLNNKTNKTFRIETSSKNNILNTCHYLYDDCSIYLDRKYEKYKMLIEYYSAVQNRNVLDN